MILIGADPELFAVDEKNNPVSVHDLIQGDKWSPVKVPHGAIQVDGVAAEFNIDPAASFDEFKRNIRHVQRLLDLSVMAKNSKLRLVAQPSVFFTESYLNSLPITVRELGCNPDFNAYSGKENVKPNAASNMRTGAGHVHVSWFDTIDDLAINKKHFKDCCEIVKALDITVGEHSTVWDSDTKRQSLYGAPGAFRPKDYGLEYRVLSNAWLNQDWTMQFVYEAVKATVERWLEGFDFSTLLKSTRTYSQKLAAIESAKIPSIRQFAPSGVLEHVAA